MKRYARNKTSISEEGQQKLKNAKICVLGCGGLGGNLIESLARIGVGNLTVVDSDCFEVSNLNRQILCTEATIGKSKAETAKERIYAINSEISVTSIQSRVNEENVISILEGHDLILDALDNIQSRKIAVEACSKLKIPFIHGGISGWNGQVATIMPGEKTLNALYDGAEMDDSLGNLAFMASHVASIQVGEAVKIVLGMDYWLKKAFLHIDGLRYQYKLFRTE